MDCKILNPLFRKSFMNYWSILNDIENDKIKIFYFILLYFYAAFKIIYILFMSELMSLSVS